MSPFILRVTADVQLSTEARNPRRPASNKLPFESRFTSVQFRIPAARVLPREKDVLSLDARLGINPKVTTVVLQPQLLGMPSDNPQDVDAVITCMTTEFFSFRSYWLFLHHVRLVMQLQEAHGPSYANIVIEQFDRPKEADGETDLTDDQIDELFKP